MRPMLPCLAILLAAANAAPDTSVPLDVRNAIINHFTSMMVLPQTADWRFVSSKPYELGGVVVCGAVNFQSSTRRYMGMLPFYAVVNHGHLKDGSILSPGYKTDPTGTDRFTYEQLCGPVP